MEETQKRSQTACYCMKIRRASAVITKLYDQLLDGSGITARQFSLLFKVSTAEHCSVRELADATELDRSTLARNLKPLYQKGLIADAKEMGARNSRLELTPEGKETLQHAGALWKEAQERVRLKLGKRRVAELDKLIGLLEEL